MKLVGKAMTENHIVLRSLGVSSPDLEKLIKAAAPSSLGVKLTGSGGGGCMIALTKNPEQTVGAIEMEGGRAFISPFNSPGVRIETLSSQDDSVQ
jgi:mevalonate kinase